MSRKDLFFGGAPWLLSALLVASVAPLNAQRMVDLPGADRPLEMSISDEYSVGSMLGDEWETFAGVSRVAFDAAGNLYILDGDNHRVVVVDGDGNFLREIGTEGDGPGELRMPFSMVVLPDGQVAVQDMGHSAFVLYDADGMFVRNVRNDFRTGLLTNAIDYHPRGGIVGASSGISMQVSGNGGTTRNIPEGAPIRFVPLDSEDPTIEDLATAYRPAPATGSGGGGTFSASGSGGGGIRMQGMPRMTAFAPPLSTTVMPDGRIAVIDSVGYNIKLLESNGGISSVWSRPIEPRKVTRRDEDAERERRTAAMDSGGSGGMRVVMRTTGGSGGGGGTTSLGGDAMMGIQRQMIESLAFAEEMPVLTQIRADWAGRIWVERTGEEVGEDGPIDLISADGEYQGTIAVGGLRLPDAFGPNGLVAYIETDEFDVATVVVKRLR